MGYDFRLQLVKNSSLISHIMRRRGVGVGAIKKRQDEAKAFTDTGRRLEEEKLAHVEELITSFRSSLEEFAGKHRARINEDPEFRQHFHRMCASIGVDPLASNKGFWADLLGVGNFYYELGIQVVQLCLQTRAENGGLMYLDDILARLRRSQARSRQNVSLDDVRRAVEKLGVLGSGYKIIEVGGREMLLSVPIELSSDDVDLIATAQEAGFVSEPLMQCLRQWPPERFRTVINVLLHEGVVWVDDHMPGERRYEFPSLQTHS